MHLFPHRSTAATLEPEPAPPENETTCVIVAYSDDCVVSGTITFHAPRLADELSHVEGIELRHVTVRSFADGHVVELRELQLDLDELCCIAAAGPRGDITRRVHTLPKLVLCHVGPFAVRGLMHAPPTADPTAVLSRRRFTAVTDASLGVRTGEGILETAHDVVLINRRHVRSIVAGVSDQEPIRKAVEAAGEAA